MGEIIDKVKEKVKDAKDKVVDTTKEAKDKAKDSVDTTLSSSSQTSKREFEEGAAGTNIRRKDDP